MEILIAIGLCLMIAAGVVLWKRRPYSRRMSLLRRSVPISAGDVAGAMPGEIVSIAGTARSDRELLSHQTRTPCVYYEYKVVRRVERRRGMVTFGTGKRRQSRRQRGSETIAENQWCVPFYVEDKSGRALVNPDGAFFEARQVLSRYERESHQWDSLGIPATGLSLGGGTRTLGHEFTENVILADAPVFVAGVVNGSGQIASTNGDGKHFGMIVTHREEAALEDEWGRRERWQTYGAIGCAGAGLFLWFIAAVQSIVPAS